MNDQALPGFPRPLEPPSDEPLRYRPSEYRIVALRECPLPASLQLCDTPDRAVAYWQMNVVTGANYNPDVECFVVLLVNTRRRVKGHHLISTGSLDSLLVHPREVFRAAIISASAGILLMHNHPSGESSPSEADIKVTRELIRGGQVLRIDVLDHIIIGHGERSSLRDQGYFAR